mgnify:CR=1 FL=1
MTTEEDIEAINNEKAFINVKRELRNALQGISTAIHYLHETSEYESSVLDEITDDLVSAHRIMEELLSD